MEKKCPKCNGLMEEGEMTAEGAIRWFKKEDKWKFGEKMYKLKAFVCNKCGYLESYIKK
jgi:predicted nucleic-acid-binding Zn-ribbon protein